MRSIKDAMIMIASIFLFSTVSSAATSVESLLIEKATKTVDNFPTDKVDCNAGYAEEGLVPIKWYCYGSNVSLVKTWGGLLIEHRQELLLNDKVLARAEWVSLRLGHKEGKKNSDAKLFIVNLSPIPQSTAIEDENTGNKFNHLYLHIVDVGVKPPFVSKERLPLAGVSEDGSRGHVKIKQLDADTYLISGESLPDPDNPQKPARKVTVKYDRKKASIEVVE